jgi:ABC-type transport system involved in multi-copper enzyme maturation permease subunit
MYAVLWILAAILVISGIVSLVRGAVLWGVILIIVPLVVLGQLSRPAGRKPAIRLRQDAVT